MGGFLSSILGAMQNWNDNTLARMPGVRDRVVRLRLKGDEGGMNLNMPPPLIAAIADRGKAAADAILARFLGTTHSANAATTKATPADAALGPTASLKNWQGWDFQRWVRLDVLLHTLADKTPGLLRSLSAPPPEASSYDKLLEASRTKVPPGHPHPLKPEEVEALQHLLGALRKVAEVFEARSDGYPNAPVPEPVLRVRPSM
jgi:hypothetical protein